MDVSPFEFYVQPKMVHSAAVETAWRMPKPCPNKDSSELPDAWPLIGKIGKMSNDRIAHDLAAQPREPPFRGPAAAPAGALSYNKRALIAVIRVEASMHFNFQVASPGAAQTVTPHDVPLTSDPLDLLRQMLETQREQLHLMKHSAAAHDNGVRWRAFLDRWKDDFADVPGACKKVLPLLERAYIGLIVDLTAHLEEQGEECAGNEFALAELLDRYGVRLNQLGALLSLVGPLAEIAAQSEAQSKK
jgi:hypothetical protein